MGYPTRQDYVEALQWPDGALTDPELRVATAVPDPQGLPRGFSGQNATVFSLRDGTTKWAVKCFIHETRDQQRRYAGISDALRRSNFAFTIPFEYQPQGIRIRSSVYPVLKMQWVEGEGLKTYIERNLQNPPALRQAAADCLSIAHTLRNAGIAHGDLQHGNILLGEGGLKLVDYDGMYVPAIAGLGSSEVGHRDYQHPQRTATAFDKSIDAFSVWVIVVSLLGLSEKPRLWATTGALSEGLLFTRKDFEQPHASSTLNELTRAANPDLKLLATHFQVVMYRDLASIELPTLNGLSPQVAKPPSAAAGTPVGVNGGADWISDHKPTKPPSSKAPSAPHADGSDWILSQLPARPPAGFETSPGRDRLYVAVAIGVGLAAVGLWAFGSLSGVDTLIAMLVVFLAPILPAWRRYGSETEVANRRIAIEAVSTAREELMRATAAATGHEKASKARRRVAAGGITEVERREVQRAAAENAAVAGACSRRDARLQQLAQERARFDLGEARELHSACQPVARRIQALDAAIAGLSGQERGELAAALQSIQAAHITGYLARRPIEAGQVTGIGPARSRDLRARGIYTAADVTYHRAMAVHGIGHTRASALTVWRAALERAASQSAPTLPPAQEAAIRTKYAQQLAQLRAQRNQANDENTRTAQGVRAKYAGLRANLPTQESTARATADREIADIVTRSVAQREAIAASLHQAHHAAADEAARDATRLHELQGKLAAAKWALRLAERDAEIYRTVTFGRYMRRILTEN